MLRALAEHGTVTAAAHALYLSPSAASQQLAALETEVGHELLERRGRSVRLTPTGAVLAAHATKIAAQLEEAEADMASCSVGLSGEVTIAAFASAITEVVAPAMATLRDRAPKVRIRVKDAEGRASRRLLIDGAVDIAVSVDHRDTPGQSDEQLLREPLYGEPFEVLLPSGHPLADAPEVDLAELSGDPWIAPWPGNPVHDVVMRACELAGFEPRAESLADDTRAVCALVSAGAGVALVPRSALHGIAVGGAVTRPVGGFRPRRRVYTTVRQGSERHPLLRLVLSELQDQAAAVGA